MPWREANAMSLRLDFVTLASHEDANVRALCRAVRHQPEHGVQVAGALPGGGAGGAGRSLTAPDPQSGPDAARPMEQLVLATRQAHPAWGGRKLKAYLEQAGYADVPAASTITAILRRHGALDDQEGAQAPRLSAFRTGGAQRAVADGLQGPFCARRWYPLSPLDGPRRPCALPAGAGRLCRRDPAARCRPQLTGRLRALRLARAHPVRSWAAVGRPQCRRRVHDA